MKFTLFFLVLFSFNQSFSQSGSVLEGEKYNNPSIGYALSNSYQGYTVGYGTQYVADIWGSKFMALIIGAGPRFSYYGSFVHYPKPKVVGLQADISYTNRFVGLNLHQELLYNGNGFQYSFSPQVGVSIFFFDAFIGPSYNLNSFEKDAKKLKLQISLKIPIFLLYD